MDFIAHGLWGGAVFGKQKWRRWKVAFWIGMAPDLLAFGPAMIAGLFAGDYRSWASWPADGIPKTAISAYSYHAYHVTHSLVVWSAVAAALWLWRKRFPVLYAAWALHILCDIPMHALRYFPTPYLWPFHTPLHDGTPWANRRFMLINYVLLAVVYVTFAALALRRKAAK